MTWAERVGDLATNIALVFINAARIVTLLVRILSERLDSLVIGLAEKGEEGIRRVETNMTAWLRLPANVFWGIASVVLRTLNIATTFVRHVATTLDDFFRTLAEGTESSA